MDKKALALALFIFSLAFFYRLPISERSSPEIKKSLIIGLSFDYEDLVTDSGEKNLQDIFRVLEKHNAKATFFVLGSTAERKPESIREIDRRGHSIGVHTYYHSFPIFRKDDAERIAIIYNTTPEYVWKRSFKTYAAFYHDLRRTQLEIMNALGDDSIPRLFRSPSLVVNWTMDKKYLGILKQAGIDVDSSVYQDFSNPRAYYIEDEIVEVPVVASEARLNQREILYNITERCFSLDVPLVLFIHPQKLNETTLEELDKFLTNLEERYNAKYAKIEEIPSLYTN
jgi:peptidoglycan/xylan/chitin deacetylase (PgdA/CDA1 family)